MLPQNQTQIWHHRERTLIDEDEAHEDGFGLRWGLGGGAYQSSSTKQKKAKERAQPYVYCGLTNSLYSQSTIS